MQVSVCFVGVLQSVPLLLQWVLADEVSMHDLPVAGCLLI